MRGTGSTASSTWEKSCHVWIIAHPVPWKMLPNAARGVDDGDDYAKLVGWMCQCWSEILHHSKPAKPLGPSRTGQWKEQPPSGCAKSRDHDGSGWIERRWVVSHTGSWNVLVIPYHVWQDITMEELLHSKGFLTARDTPPLHTAVCHLQ